MCCLQLKLAIQSLSNAIRQYSFLSLYLTFALKITEDLYDFVFEPFQGQNLFSPGTRNKYKLPVLSYVQTEARLLRQQKKVDFTKQEHFCLCGCCEP